MLAVLGCWKIGAVPVPMRWDLPDWERSRVLEVIDPAVIVDEQSRQLTARAGHQSDNPLPAVVSPNANGICSSGSTGLPKVILTLAQGTWTPESSFPFLAAWAPTAQPQTILVPAPMYHTNGFSPLTYLLGGDRLVVLEKFDAATVVDVIERYRVTNFTATPTMLARIAALPDIRQRDLSSVAWILQGAAVMPHALLRTWFDLLSPEQVVMAYGMTEGLGITALRGDEWLAHRWQRRPRFPGHRSAHPGPTRRAGESRRARRDLSALADERRIPLSGRRAACCRRHPTASAPAGDIGHVDADGYLYIADRRSDMIITGGANVFPAEVECALAEHDGIADVVVIGLSDREWGRRVHAVVQLADPAQPLTERDVIAYAKTRLAAYKVPKTVEFVDQIPRTAATKVNRSAMVEARGG